MSWAEWDTNLDGYMATSYLDINNITIAAVNGALCTTRSKEGAKVPDANEIAKIVKYLNTKSGDGLTFGGMKLMFTREIDDSILIFNIIGVSKGALAVCKTASNNFAVIACGAGPEKNSQAVGVNAVKCLEFLKSAL